MNLLLLGDSIRIGYTPYVRELLSPAHAVQGPEDNGRFTLYTLRYLHDWAARLDSKPDIVHWNNGLWDATQYTVDRAPLVSLAAYESNLRRILTEIRGLFPGASIVFALTTPVAAAHPAIENHTLDAMNRVAAEVMAAEGVSVNDLHGLVLANPAYLSEDAIHMTQAGYRALAEAVVRAVGLG